MRRAFAVLVALAPVSHLAGAERARGELGVSCRVVPSASFRVAVDTSPDAGGGLVVASRAGERAGWFVSSAGEAVLERTTAEGAPREPPSAAGVVVVTVFPDGAPERVTVLDGAR